jgi:hypothetical protein
MPTVKPGTPATEPKRQQWEHQQHEGRQFPVQMGADGWELVCVTEAVNGLRTFYFKRPNQSRAQP